MSNVRKFSRDEVIRHLLFRIQKLETVLDAALAIRENGLVGRGKEVNGAQVVQVNHKHWVDLIESAKEAAISSEEQESA